MRAGMAAWGVLAAWLGFVLGLGLALRPSLAALPPAEAAHVAERWHQAIGAAPAPGLWLGRACPCEQAAQARLAAWAGQAGIPVHTAPEASGVALFTASGELRYTGEAVALLAHCGGPGLLAALWRAPAALPLSTPACVCEGAGFPPT